MATVLARSGALRRSGDGGLDRAPVTGSSRAARSGHGVPPMCANRNFGHPRISVTDEVTLVPGRDQSRAKGSGRHDVDDRRAAGSCSGQRERRRRCSADRRRSSVVGSSASLATGDATAITLAFAVVHERHRRLRPGPRPASSLYTVAAGAIGLLSLRAQGLWQRSQASPSAGRAGRRRQGRRLHPRRRPRRRPGPRPGAAPALDHRRRRPRLRSSWSLWRSLLRSWLTVNRRQGRMVQPHDRRRHRRAGDGDRPHRRGPPRGRHPGRRHRRLARRGRGRRSRPTCGSASSPTLDDVLADAPVRSASSSAPATSPRRCWPA